MSRELTRNVMIPAVIVSMGWLGVARAETPEDRAQALSVVQEGNRLLDAGDALGALERFGRALALVQSPKLHFNFGQALAGIAGREAEAHEEFAKYLVEVPNAEIEKRAEANRQLGFLRGKLALFSIRTTPEGVGVSIDGQPRGVTPLARPIALSPGTHEVRLTLQGRASISEVIHTAAGEEKVKEYLLGPVTAGPTGETPATPEPLGPATATPSPPSTRPEGMGGRGTNGGVRRAALVVAGTGVALAVTGLFVYRAGAAKLDNIKRAANLQPPGQYDDADGNYRTLGNTGIALMLTGAAAVATGAVLYLVYRDGDAPAGESGPATVSLGYLPGVGGQVLVGGRY